MVRTGRKRGLGDSSKFCQKTAMIGRDTTAGEVFDAIEVARGSSWKQWGAEILLSVLLFHAALIWPAGAGWLVLFSLVFLLRLRRAATVRRAFYGGLLVGMGIMGPQLMFFWKVFGPFAVLLWFLLAIWVAIFCGLGKAVESRFGRAWGMAAAPVLWFGLEFVRCEVWSLRFSWLTPGFALPAETWAGCFHHLGIYGAGALLVCAAAWAADTSRGPIKWALLLALPFGLMALPAAKAGSGGDSKAIHVAGVQWENPLPEEVIAGLDAVLKASPAAQLIVLSEYTYNSTPPPEIGEWCRKNRRHVMVGGIERQAVAGTADEKEFNTAFIVGPEGEILHRQVKSVPIQFMRDGEPAPSQQVWDSPMGRIGVAICYDMNYARVMDGLIAREAELLVIPAMDVLGWGENAHRLSAQLAAVRAAEYGVPLFRLASSGFSRITTHDGRVACELGIPGQGEVIHGQVVMPGKGRRPFDRWLAWPCVALTAGLMLFFGFEKVRRVRWRRSPVLP